jgi:N-acylneuraminate cytidylyltransferase
MTLAIIPARGGSRRIPRKNIRAFCGKPIIAYSIEAALTSGCFDEVIVSTDDAEIARVALAFGARVPFMRSQATSTDTATTADVLREVIGRYRERGEPAGPRLACCLYPTAPFVTADMLREGLRRLMADPEIPGVVSVTPFSHPIQRALQLTGDRLSMARGQCATTRTQDLEPAYHDAGQFYWFRVTRFLENSNLLDSGAIGFVMPNAAVQDIDHEDDWTIAEMKYRLLLERQAGAGAGGSAR